MSENITIAHSAMADLFTQKDPHSMGVYKALMDVYPALAKKLFHNNKMMQDLVTSNMNPINILSYPVCGRCETLALWDGRTTKDGKRVRKCTCTAIGCGATTVNPVTFKEWIQYELMKRVPKEFIDALPFMIDDIALAYLSKATREYQEIEAQQAAMDADSIGIHLPQGGYHEVKKSAPRVSLEERAMSDEELLELQKQIKESYK
jgi:hypothetical protein